MIDEGNLPATLARHLLARLTEQEQLELVKSLDTTKRYTAAMVQRKVTELQSADAGMEKRLKRWSENAINTKQILGCWRKSSAPWKHKIIKLATKN